MKTKILLLLLLPLFAIGQTIEVPKAGTWQFVDGTVPPDSVPPCQTCPPGPAGRGIQTTTVDPVTGEVTFIYTDQTQSKTGPLKGEKGDKGDPGENGLCPNCPPSGGTGTGSVLRTVFFVENYAGTNGGNGSNDDTPAFQSAFTAAIAVSGEVFWNAAPNFWNIKNTIQVVPRSGQSQLWIDVTGHGSVHQMRYTGAGNKPVFRILGLKNGNWDGIRMSLSGSGVTAFDIVTSDGSNSSTTTTFTNMRINLGDGIDNVGVRMGAENGGNGDISHYTFINVSVYGGGALRGQGSPIAGQYGFQNLGHNTLANLWVNCFTAQLDVMFTNSSRDGTKRGNSAVTFQACGGAHNGTDFVTAWEGPLNIFGGRYENGHRRFIEQKNTTAGKYQQITVDGAIVKDYNAPGGYIIDILRPTSLSLNNVILINGRSDTKFTKPIRLGSSGDFGNLRITGGGILSDNARPYVIEGTTKWNITVDGVAKMGASASEGNIRSVGFFDNEIGVRK